MKKLLTIILFFIPAITYSQANILDIGAEGGFSIASLRGNEFIEKYHSARIGYTGGLFAQYNFRKIISIRTGCYFERKGSAIELEATDVTGQAIGIIHGASNFDYLTIPLLLRASFGKKWRFFLNAGPYISFLLKETTHTDAFNDFPESDSDNTNHYKNTETGLSVGIGLSYALKKRWDLSFEVRDNYGLENISELEVYNGGTIKTNALNFLLGITYKLGQRNTDNQKPANP